MGHIKALKAREILDSRGMPTVEVDLITDDGEACRAAVPSGASTGIYEALELRDGDESRFGGKGVLKAVENINKIIGPALAGMDVTHQEAIDRKMVDELDGTQGEWGSSKSKLGANAILAVSMAVCRAGATASKKPLYEYIATLAKKDTSKMYLPVPCFNVINGGCHAGNKLAMQEFMIVPVGAKTFQEAVHMGATVYGRLKIEIKKKYGPSAINVGDEGGFAPNISRGEEALDFLVAAINDAGLTGKVKIAMDPAASEFHRDDKYDLDFKSTEKSSADVLSGTELCDLYKKWAEKYPIISIEDPFEQDDWKSFKMLTSDIGAKVQIVGDDLLVTNKKRIEKAIENKACNALLLKVNQIGSVTESIEACLMAHANGWGVMVSHRSGETDDHFIADLAVGLGTRQIKSGAPCRGERTAKYNQLLRIEESLGSRAVFPGENFRQC